MIGKINDLENCRFLQLCSHQPLLASCNLFNWLGAKLFRKWPEVWLVWEILNFLPTKAVSACCAATQLGPMAKIRQKSHSNFLLNYLVILMYSCNSLTKLFNFYVNCSITGNGSWCESAETCLEKLVRSYQQSLFLAGFSRFGTTVGQSAVCGQFLREGDCWAASPSMVSVLQITFWRIPVFLPTSCKHT